MTSNVLIESILFGFTTVVLKEHYDIYLIKEEVVKNETYRKCSECGTMTMNSDYCKNCGTLININLRRKQEREEKELLRKEKNRLKTPNALAAFFEKARTHENPIVRVLANVIYSVWMVVFAIGAFFAYIFGYIAA